MLAVPLGLALAPSNSVAGTAAPGLELPSWFFAAVWTVLYPCLGVATWTVWKGRGRPGAQEALVMFAMSFLVSFAFVPVTLAASDIRVTAMMDLLAMAMGYAAAWAYCRVDRTAARWLVPHLCWLPITTVLKLWTVAQAA